MTLFSDGLCHYSHRVRLVLAEKGISVDIVDSETEAPPAELAALNPYRKLPLLVDRDLVLYEPRVMMEYLDERFPHPPLLPAYPVARSESRQLICRIERDWAPLVDALSADSAGKQAATHRQTLCEQLVALAPVFAGKPFFMSDEFTLVDCCMAPILWRLPQLGIELPRNPATQSLYGYMERLFERPTFKSSLSAQESSMPTPRAA